MARTEYSPDCESPRSPRARRYTRRTYMSVTRAAALRRLVSKWLEATRLDPAKVAQLPLCEILTEDNVEAVRALDLYAEYDERPTRRRAWAVADQLRQQRATNQQLVRALGCRTRGQGCCNDRAQRAAASVAREPAVCLLPVRSRVHGLRQQPVPAGGR
jgi:hypothetical protein